MREVKTKTTRRNESTPIGTAETLASPNACEKIQKWGHSCTASESVEGAASQENLGSFLEK